MMPQPPIRQEQAENWSFFLRLPETDRNRLNLGQVKDVQLLEPLFEFSGACAGCGETPYIKLVSRRRSGDRGQRDGVLVDLWREPADHPGPSTTRARAPAWANSLFEDNAEFGLGMRLALAKQAGARARLPPPPVGGRGGRAGGRDPPGGPVHRDGHRRATGARAAAQGAARRGRPARRQGPARRRRHPGQAERVDHRRRRVGLRHRLRRAGPRAGLGHDVNVLVLDTEVYSNTGGQMSKATLGARWPSSPPVASRGQEGPGLMVMTYGHVYVARVAMGGNDAQTVQAFREPSVRRAVTYRPTATASRTATICASGWINKGRRPFRPLAPLPLQSRPGEGGQNPCSSIPSRRVCP